MQKTLYLFGKIALPFLMGLLLVLSKFSENAHRIPWAQLPQSLLFGLIVSGVAFGIFYAVPITRKVAGLVSSVFVVITMLWMVFPSQLIPVALMLLAIALLPKLQVKTVTAFCALILGVACIVSLITAGVNTNRIPVQASQNGEIRLLRTPDVYFIVPDRFTSPVGLLAMGYDNSAFVSYLRGEGFYVNEGALSKDRINPTDRGVATTRTSRFMASVLNLGKEVDLNIPYNVCSQMIKYNKVVRILKSNGYKYYHIGDWWPETETNPLADVNYVYKGGSFMPTEELPMVLLDRSIWRYVNTFGRSSDVHRNRNLFQSESLREAVNATGPKFVFMHVLLPHPPFVWTANGTAQEEELAPYELYIEQVKYAETFLKEIIEAVPDDAILIIQSDEGVCFTKPSLNYNLTNDQWRGVLGAWRVPGDASLVNIVDILGYVIEKEAE